MIFIAILMLSALTISVVAGYFSIYGLASIFTGAFIPVIVMGASLELGKLVAASYVYRFWDRINFLLKSYLIISIIVLMVITSTGIFGFLSSAYQQDSMPLKEMNQIIVLLKSEKTELLFRKRQIDKDISSLPSNYISGRERLMKKYGPELTKINSRLENLTKEVQDISKKKLTQEAHTGPIIYIAKVFNKDVDNAIKYMILLLIFVFDPLAVILIICTNIAISHYREDKLKPKPKLKYRDPMDKASQSVIQHAVSKKDIIDSVRSSANN